MDTKDLSLRGFLLHALYCLTVPTGIVSIIIVLFWPLLGQAPGQVEGELCERGFEAMFSLIYKGMAVGGIFILYRLYVTFKERRGVL